VGQIEQHFCLKIHLGGPLWDGCQGIMHSTLYKWKPAFIHPRLSSVRRMDGWMDGCQRDGNAYTLWDKWNNIFSALTKCANLMIIETCQFLTTTRRSLEHGICPNKVPTKKKLGRLINQKSTSFFCASVKHCVRASPPVLSMWLQTVKFIVKKVKMCRFSSGNWFFCTKFVQLAVAGKRRDTVVHLQRRV